MRTIWMGHVAFAREACIRDFCGEVRGKRSASRSRCGCDYSIILKWMLHKYDGTNLAREKDLCLADGSKISRVPCKVVNFSSKWVAFVSCSGIALCGVRQWHILPGKYKETWGLPRKSVWFQGNLWKIFYLYLWNRLPWSTCSHLYLFLESTRFEFRPGYRIP